MYQGKISAYYYEKLYVKSSFTDNNGILKINWDKKTFTGRLRVSLKEYKTTIICNIGVINVNQSFIIGRPNFGLDIFCIILGNNICLIILFNSGFFLC